MHVDGFDYGYAVLSAACPKTVFHRTASVPRCPHAVLNVSRNIREAVRIAVMSRTVCGRRGHDQDMTRTVRVACRHHQDNADKLPNV